MDATLVRGSGRLQAYSDAIFSIVATVMILPVAHTEIPEDQALGANFVNLLVPKIAVYIYTFLVVCSTWASHARLFDIIEQVDEFIVLLNLAFMMVTTFLPFTFTLLSFNFANALAIQLFCIAVFLIGILQLFAILHAFRHPRMLRQELENDENRFMMVSLWFGKVFTRCYKTAVRTKLILKVVTPSCIALIAGLLSFLSTTVAILILLLYLVSNYIRRQVVRLYNKCGSRLSSARGHGLEDSTSPSTIHTSNLEDSSHFNHMLLKETLTKDRIEFFSDGVFAIVATLIILDICENNIPTAEDVEKAGSLLKALSKDGYIFFAYFGTFMTVALQWFVHHSMFHYVKEFNMLMVVLNNLCLLSVGLNPLAFQLISNFDERKSYEDESISIQLNCIVLFMAGIFQCLIWVVALFKEEQYLLPAARHGGEAHGYISAKLAVYPLLSITMYFVSVFGRSVQTMAFITTQLCAVGLFIMLGLLFTQVQKIYAWIFWRGTPGPHERFEEETPETTHRPQLFNQQLNDFEETRSHSPITA